MQPHPPFNRPLLTIIAIGIVLILVIGGTLLTHGPGSSPFAPTASPSGSISPKLGTLAISPPAGDRDETISTATPTVPDASPISPAETLAPTSTLTGTPMTPSLTPTPAGIQPLKGGKYDDTDPNIAYDPYWTPLKNASTAKSYKGTIHDSTNVGSEASFRFTGKGFRLGYKRGKSFGTVTVIIDDQPTSFNEQAFDLVWSSPQLSSGDHFVRIIHESGEAVNLDYIVILE
jgi:hypothetical protein